MLADLRWALRSLSRRPLYSVSVALILAIGLGAGATMLHLVDAVLLRPLPYPDADRLVAVFATVTRDSVERRAFSTPDFRDLAARTRSFERLAAYDAVPVDVRGAGRSERVLGVFASEGYLEMLGARPVLGSGLAGGWEPSEPREVVVSHGYWTTRLGTDPAAVGRELDLGDRPAVIRGVLSPDFVPLVDGADLWGRMADLPPPMLEDRSRRWHSVVGRLAATTDQTAARAEMEALFRALEEAHPDSNLHYGADLEPLAENLFGSLRRPLWTLLAAVGLVLGVLCANVAGLLLAREARRSGDTAVRLALGASGWQVGRPRVAEVAVLLLGGGLGAIGVAAGLLGVLARLDPVGLPGLVDLSFGPRALLLAAALFAAVAGVLAVVAALVGWRRDGIAATLRVGTARLRPRQPAMSVLLVVEVALATVLAVGAGLFLASLDELSRVPPGFASDGLAFLGLELPRPAEGESNGALRRRVLEEIGALPGVRRVSFTTGGLLEGGYSATVVSTEGAQRRPGEPWDGATRVYRHLVGPGFFEAIGAGLLEGRELDARDGADSGRVAVVSRRLARALWGDVSPLGRRFKVGSALGEGEDPSEVEWVTVVGMAPEIRHRSLVATVDGAPEDPDVYFPIEQLDPRTVQVVAATEVRAAGVLPAMRSRIEALDPGIVLFPAGTVEERLREQTRRPRFATWLLSGFAGVGLLLSAVGIWALVAFQVTARWREIGVRMAVGASRRRVVGEIVRRTAIRVVGGAGLGIGVAVVLARVVASQLYGVRPLEPSVYAATAALVVALGLAAAFVPARRAGALDPIAVLRSE